jgi:hypothetical protein
MRTQKNIKFKDLLIILIGEIKSVIDHFGEVTKYAGLIRIMKMYNLDKSSSLPSQKDLINSLKMSRSQLMNLMQSLYQDFMVSISKSYSVDTTEVFFAGETKSGNYFQVCIENIRHVPSVGDIVKLPFILTKYGRGAYCKVKEVVHEVEGNRHSIVLFINESFD